MIAHRLRQEYVDRAQPEENSQAPQGNAPVNRGVNMLKAGPPNAGFALVSVQICPPKGFGVLDTRPYFLRGTARWAACVDGLKSLIVILADSGA